VEEHVMEQARQLSLDESVLRLARLREQQFDEANNNSREGAIEFEVVELLATALHNAYDAVTDADEMWANIAYSAITSR
jgi:hypothetical protein